MVALLVWVRDMGRTRKWLSSPRLVFLELAMLLLAKPPRRGMLSYY